MVVRYDRNMDKWMGQGRNDLPSNLLESGRKTNVHVCTFRYQKISISFKTANGELDFLFSKEDDENSWLS